MNNLCRITIYLLLILNIRFLYKRYLRKKIDVHDKNFAMLVLRKSRQISKDSEISTLIITLIRKYFTIRIFKDNKFLEYKNAFKRHICL